MTPIGCARALADFLNKTFQEMDFTPTDEKVAGNKITIRDGFLPKRMSAKEKQEQDPCVIIRPVKINDTEDGSSVELEVLVLTYNSDADNGHLELYHLLEVIRQAIETSPLIGKGHRLEKPVTTVIPEEQPFPEWWAYMQVTYTIGSIVPAYSC